MSMLYMVLERQKLCCHTLSNNGPRLVTQSKITSTHLFPVLLAHRPSSVRRFSDALMKGSCKNNRNQTVTDAYQSDNVLAETQNKEVFVLSMEAETLSIVHVRQEDLSEADYGL